MVSLTARLLLLRTAREYVGGRKSFSKEEIVKRINEIKYLSAQKKVPKLTLRKEIIHLEQKLKDIFELEQKLLDQEKRESAKIIWLKQEVSLLKKRIAVSADHDLQKKVDHLSTLLGESLAKQAVIEEIAQQRILPSAAKPESTEAAVSEPKEALTKELLERLQLLKQEIISREEANPSLAKKLLEKVAAIEERCKSLLPALVLEEPAARHTFIFNEPRPQPVKVDQLELERELPLPPPPKMVE